MSTPEAEVPPQPIDLIAFKWAESVSEHTQNALRTSEVRQLQEMIDNTFASALAEVWEKAIAIARAVEEDDLRPTDGVIGAQVVREGLEAARDAALSVQKENKDEQAT